jgi:hypothetical protein
VDTQRVAQPLYIGGVGPISTAPPPNGTVGQPFAVQEAGTLFASVTASGFNTVNSGIEIAWLVDGTQVATTKLNSAHPVSAHQTLSTGIFAVNLSAGTHYLYGYVVAGKGITDTGDDWTMRGNVYVTEDSLNYIIRALP